MINFKEQEKIRNEGYEAYWDDIPREKNPYKEGSEEYEWWNIGHTEGFNSGYEDFNCCC